MYALRPVFGRNLPRFVRTRSELTHALPRMPAPRQVAQWLSFAEHQAPKMASSAALDVCNRFLLPRAYLATSGVSLADVAVYFSLHPVVVRGVPCAHGLVPPHPVAAQKDLDADARAAHCNVTRWFNQTQHELRAKASSLPPVVPIELPTARFPNVEAASVAPPADGKGKGQGKGEAKGKKAGKGEKAGAGAAEEGKGGKKADKKAGKKKGSDQPAPPAGARARACGNWGRHADTQPARADMHVGLLDIRVGLIKSCAKHEKADKLYVESIDVGEEKPRDIASGLVGLVPLEEMQDRMVLVLCNMKPRPMVGFKSHGMVLCASNEDHTKVDPVKPPEGSRPGDRVVAKGFESEPASPNFVNKKKVIQTVLPVRRSPVAALSALVAGCDANARAVDARAGAQDQRRRRGLLPQCHPGYRQGRLYCQPPQRVHRVVQSL